MSTYMSQRWNLENAKCDASPPQNQNQVLFTLGLSLKSSLHAMDIGHRSDVQQATSAQEEIHSWKIRMKSLSYSRLCPFRRKSTLIVPVNFGTITGPEGKILVPWKCKMVRILWLSENRNLVRCAWFSLLASRLRVCECKYPFYKLRMYGPGLEEWVSDFRISLSLPWRQSIDLKRIKFLIFLKRVVEIRGRFLHDEVERFVIKENVEKMIFRRTKWLGGTNVRSCWTWIVLANKLELIQSRRRYSPLDLETCSGEPLLSNLGGAVSVCCWSKIIFTKDEL